MPFWSASKFLVNTGAVICDMDFSTIQNPLELQNIIFFKLRFSKITACIKISGPPWVLLVCREFCSTLFLYGNMQVLIYNILLTFSCIMKVSKNSATTTSTLLIFLLCQKLTVQIAYRESVQSHRFYNATRQIWAHHSAGSSCTKLHKFS